LSYSISSSFFTRLLLFLLLVLLSFSLLFYDLIRTTVGSRYERVILQIFNTVRVSHIHTYIHFYRPGELNKSIQGTKLCYRDDIRRPMLWLPYLH
jgi:hypothetical protein